MDPTISVGGILEDDRRQYPGRKVRESLSQKPANTRTVSFISYPKISVILNIEEDHLDFFKDLEDIRHSFHQFAVPYFLTDGTLIINGDIKDYQEIY